MKLVQDLMELVQDNNLKRKMKQKIRTYKHDDKKKRAYDALNCDDKYVSYDFILNMIINSNLKICSLCNCDLLYTNYQPYEKKQYSIDRIDSNLFHTEHNIQIICFYCNRRKQNK